MIDEIQLKFGIIKRIISDHLQLKKIIARWVPNILTDAHERV